MTDNYAYTVLLERASGGSSYLRITLTRAADGRERKWLLVTQSTIERVTSFMSSLTDSQCDQVFNEPKQKKKPAAVVSAAPA